MSERERREALIERALEDLEAEEIAAIRAELSDDGEALAEFEALIELRSLSVEALSPPSSLDGPILEAARAAARDRGARDGDDAEAALPRLQRWLSSALRGPQVAMATISLLVVAISLFFVPFREQMVRDGSDSTLTQATRELPQERGERGARELAEGEGFMDEAEAGEAAPPSSATAGSAGVARKRAAPERVAPEKSTTERSATERSATGRPLPQRSMPERAERPAGTAADQGSAEITPRSAGSAQVKEQARAQAPQRLAAPEASMMAAERVAPMRADSAADDEASARERDERDTRAEPAPEDARTAGAARSIDELQTLVARKAYSEAASLGRELLKARSGRSPEIATILSLVARAERGLGRCDRAMPLYERLLREYPERAAAEGIVEKMAACAADTR